MLGGLQSTFKRNLYSIRPTKKKLQYSFTSHDSVREAWISAQDSLNRLKTSDVERNPFFSKMAFYKGGEKTRRLLARIARSHQSSPP